MGRLVLFLAIINSIAAAEDLLLPSGGESIEVTASQQAKIYIFNEEALFKLMGEKKRIDWNTYQFFKIEDKKYFERYCENKGDAKLEGLAEFFFTLAASGYTTPHKFENIASGRYLIWVSAPNGDKLRCGFAAISVTNKKPEVVHFHLNDMQINVISKPPGFPIILDGADTGRKTPHTFLFPYSISPGSKEVEIRNPGYYERSTGREELKQTAYLSSEKAQEIFFDLVEEATAPKQYLEVNADPGPAEIWVNDRSFGQTPVKVQFPLERPNVIISAAKSHWKGCNATREKAGSNFDSYYKQCTVVTNPEKTKIQFDLEREWARGFFIAAVGSTGLGSYSKSYSPYWGGMLGWHGESTRPFGWLFNTYFGYSENYRKNTLSCSNLDLCPIENLWLMDLNVSLGPNVSLWRLGISVAIGAKISMAAGGGNTAISLPVSGFISFVLPTGGSLLLIGEYVSISHLLDAQGSVNLMRVGLGYVLNGFATGG